MTRVIDERVVEMRFDNKQFESATKETLGTLSRLKESLNSTASTKSFKELDKSIRDIKLDGIAAGIEQLTKRFSLFGEVTRRVQMNVINSLRSIVTRGISYVDNAIISGGQRRAMNIENARFQLQQIVKDTESVAQIMDVASASVDGTAYSFDVAAKAASQFTASGVTDMTSLGAALKGLAGTTATFNADYEQMAMIWTQVAGQGRLMGDQLLQLSTRGANAAVTIADYMNGVSSGTIEASGNVKAMVAAISGGLKLTEADIRDFTSKGKINFEIFSEAMAHAFGDSAKEANKTFNGSLANIRAALARIGEGFFSPLIAENSELVRLFNAIRLRINDVKKSLVFDKEIGNVYALSKQVTDYLLGLIGALADWVENLDLTDTMALFYYWVEIVKGSFQALGSVLKPVGLAIKEVFFNFKMDGMIRASDTLLKLVRGLKLSEEASNALKNGFVGMLKPVKLVLDIFGKLVSALFKIDNPLGSVLNGVIKLAGAFGKSIGYLTDWVRSSAAIQKSYEGLGIALNGVIGYFRKFIDWIGRFGREIEILPAAKSILTAIVGCFYELGTIAGPYILEVSRYVREFASELAKMIPEKVNRLMEGFAGTIERIREALKNLSFKKHSKEIQDYTYEVDDLRISMASVGNPITDLIKLLSDLSGTKKDLVDFGPQIDKIEEFKKVIVDFGSWMKKVLGQLFRDTTMNDLISGAAGVGIVYSFSKAAKAIETMFIACRDLIPPLNDIAKSIGSVAKSIANLPKQFEQMLSGVNAAIKAYQRDLNASALIKTAGAIAILAGAIGLLSLLDTDKLWMAAKSLSLIAISFLGGLTLLKKASAVGKTTADSLYEFTVGLHKAMDNFSKAKKWKAISSTIKSLGVTIALIAGSMIALAVMYKRDEANLKAAIGILAGVATAIVGVIAVMSGLGMFLSKGMTAFNKAASGLTMISLSIGIAVFALNKLFKMTIPVDAEDKIKILGGIFGALGLLTLILAEAAKTADGNKLNTTPILALTLMLITTVAALDKLFKMKLPNDWGWKAGILAGIFMALGGVMIAIGYAAKLAGGKLKATGTILAMCLFVGTVVAALMVLTLIPFEKLLKGAISLGVVLLALGGALYGAGQVADPNASKAVLAMAITLGAITASLAILGIMNWTDLAKSAVALGGVLLSLAAALNGASKVTNKISVAAIISFIVEVGVIAAALYVLSEKPWEAMAASGAAISACLLSLGAVAGIINAVKFSPGSIAVLLEGIVALIAVAGVLYVLSNQPWEAMKEIGEAISTVLLSMAAAMGICTFVGTLALAAITGIGLLDLFIANFALVLYALGQLTDNAKAIMGNGLNILSDIGFAIGDFVGQIVKGFTEAVVSTLPAIGTALSGFAQNMGGFIQSIREIDDSVVQGVKNLAIMVITITAAEFMQGITKWITGGNTLAKFGAELVAFGPLIRMFAWEVRGIDVESVKGAAAAGMIMAELANRLPDSGGLKAKIFGETTLSEFGAELVKFGPSLKVFALVVKGIDESSVQGAAAAGMMLAELARSIPATGGLKALFTGDNSLDGFGQKLVTFGMCLKSFDESVASINITHLLGIINAFQKLIDASAMINAVDTTNITKFSTALTAMAQGGINGFMKAFEDSTEKVKRAINNFVNEIISVIDGRQRDFANSAENVMIGFTRRAQQVLTDEEPRLVHKIQNAGTNVARGLANGMNGGLSAVVTAATGMAKSIDTAVCQTMDIHSPAGVMIIRAQQMGQGLVVGINDSKAPVQAAMADLMSGVVAEAEKGFNLLNTYSVYGQDVLKPLTKKLNQTKKLTKKIPQEITNLENGASAAKKAGTAQSKKDNEDKYKLEDDYWSHLLAIKREGHEKEKYLETTIQDFRKEVLEEAKKAYEEYMNQLQSTRESIMEQMSIFDEVEEKEVIDKEELIYIMEDQIDAHEEYLELLKSLDRRLEGSPLYDYLAKMGIESLDQLREISRMTDRELSTYAMLYDEKMALATDTALYQLSDMEAQTNAKLAEIFGGMTDAVNLFDFGTYFDGSIESITGYVEDIMLPLQRGMQSIQEAPAVYTEAVVDSLGNMVGQISGEVKTSVEKIENEIGPGFQTAGESAGKSMGDGIGAGLQTSEEPLSKVAAELINKLNTSLKTAGEIHSPSMLSHREIGIPFGQGIGNGMIDPIVLATLQAAANLLSSNLVTYFGNNRDKLVTIGKAIVSTVSLEIQNNSENLETSGNTSIDSFISGIVARLNSVKTTIDGMMTVQILGRISDKYQTVRNYATMTMTFFLNGLQSKYEAIKNSLGGLLTAMVGKINNTKSQFYNAGKNVGQGFVEGVRAKIGDADRAGAALGNAALNAAKRALDENSPSRKMMKIGAYAGEGFVGSLMSYVAKAAEAGKDIGDSASNAVNDSMSRFSEVIDFGELSDPIIRPEVDLSNVESAALRIQKLFNEAIKFSGIEASNLSASIDGARGSVQIDQKSNGAKPTEPTKFEFTQNNYSPKALSREDIYRQTKNQFSRLKELVNK